MVAEDGRHLRCACGPSLPESYHAALNGVPIGPPYIGTCGEVVDQCVAVSVPDVVADTRFAPEWRSLLLAHGLHAVRSKPVCDAQGRPVAYFAIYHDRPRDPTPSDPELIKVATNLAAVILEHHRVEHALREATKRSDLALEKLEEVYHMMPVGMAVLDVELRFVRVDETLAQINGVSVADHLGRTVRDVVPEVSEKVEGYFRRGFETGEPAQALEFEAPTPATGGEPRVWLENATPLRDEQGHIRWLLVTVLDITERKRAEEALRASEERYRLLVESATDYAMVTLDLKGTITGWNTGAERMMGYSEAEALGQEIGIFFTPEDCVAGVPRDEMRPARQDGRAENERWHVREDGSRFWRSGLVTPLTNGHQRGYVKIFQDKTATYAAMQRLRAAVEGSPFPIMLHAEDGEVLSLSRSWTDSSGFAPEEIPTHHAWFRLAFPGQHKAVLEELEREFVAEQVIKAGEFTIRTKAGTTRVWDF